MFSKNLRGAMEIGEITPKVYRWGKALRRLHTCTELCSHLGNHIMINHAILFLHWIISKWPTCCDSHFFPTKILVVFPLKGNNWELMQKYYLFNLALGLYIFPKNFSSRNCKLYSSLSIILIWKHQCWVDWTLRFIYWILEIQNELISWPTEPRCLCI